MNALVAQVSQPAEGLASSFYLPLYLIVLLYVGLLVAGRVLGGRGDARAEPVQDAGFAVMLLAGVYVLVLLVMAVFSEFNLIVDMVQIMAIMVAFFAVLVVILLAIELLLGLIGRRRHRETRPGSGSSSSSAEQ